MYYRTSTQAVLSPTSEASPGAAQAGVLPDLPSINNLLLDVTAMPYGERPITYVNLLDIALDSSFWCQLHSFSQTRKEKDFSIADRVANEVDDPPGADRESIYFERRRMKGRTRVHRNCKRV